jgi:AcrR family transcriptional regulator
MTNARRKAKRKPVREPQQARAVQTRERLLDVAGELLAEVGIERISTNMISAHAGVTPPTLYRYFKDKYAVLEALGQRLMDRQNAVLLAWLEKHKGGGADAYADNVEDLLRDTAAITASEPGGIWIERALRAVPQLAYVRINSHRSVTDAMLEVYAPLLPDMDPDLLWRRIRLSVEYGYATDEMLSEEDLIPREEILREAARLLRWSLRDAEP